MGASRSNLVLGLLIVAFSLVLLFVWVPLDTETGLIEKVRRQVTIGDALAPTVAGLFLLIGGAILVLFERKSPQQPTVGLSSLGFIGAVALVLIVSLLAMRFAGPALVAIANLASDTPQEYRPLRDAIPWKYTGYLLGGSAMLVGLISLVEGRVRALTVGVAIAAVVVLIILYDLPFDDLLLPPNGDV